jgi:uncharacterized protein (TIGR02145 family)
MKIKSIIIATCLLFGATGINAQNIKQDMQRKKQQEVQQQQSIKAEAERQKLLQEERKEGHKGVVINGVRWATRNVDAPGTFADKPESAGMLYQWNRNVGWSNSDPLFNSNGRTSWNNSLPSGSSWEKANDPSPAGWRIPTKDELKTLFDTDKVSSTWTKQNGVGGRKFTDKATGKTLFLPDAGVRFEDGRLDTGGQYWSSTLKDNGNPYRLYFENYMNNPLIGLTGEGLSIASATSLRSVADETYADNTQVLSSQSSAQTPNQNEGVVISGVTWATHNVDRRGTFTDKPESTGVFYQWGREVGKNTNKDLFPDRNGGSKWERVGEGANSSSWANSSDPSPKGWRVPTKDEIETLLDESKVERKSIFQNGIAGTKFTDKTTGNSIFLPAAGYFSALGDYNGYTSDRKDGYYWSSVPAKIDGGHWGIQHVAYYLFSNTTFCKTSSESRLCGMLVRPVKD